MNQGCRRNVSKNVISPPGSTRGMIAQLVDHMLLSVASLQLRNTRPSLSLEMFPKRSFSLSLNVSPFSLFLLPKALCFSVGAPALFPAKRTIFMSRGRVQISPRFPLSPRVWLSSHILGNLPDEGTIFFSSPKVGFTCAMFRYIFIILRSYLKLAKVFSIIVT